MTPTAELKKYVRVSNGSASYYVLPLSELGTLQYELMESDVGEKYELEVCEYTQAEVDAMPEFEGF